MKKYKIIICIVITIIITGVGVGAYQNHKQEQREAYVRGLYHAQSLSYPRTNERFEQYEYFDYSIINERQLYIGLMAYNEKQNKSETI